MSCRRPIRDSYGAKRAAVSPFVTAPGLLVLGSGFAETDALIRRVVVVVS